MSGRLALGANVALLGFIAFIAWLNAAYPSVYYVSAQEDRALEWASFWSFFVAGIIFFVAAWRERRSTARLPWFLVGLGLFCLLVAMEEISWGQRVFGQLPPEYFLAENYQQEITLHNFASQGLRVGVFRGIILGYGVVLPVVALIDPARRALDRLGVFVPPMELSPSMFALFWLHLQYPWKFTGEIVECGLGFAFLFIAMVAARRFGTRRDAAWVTALVLPAAVVALGFGTAAWSQNRTSGSPEIAHRAEAETRALAADFAALAEAEEKTAITKCGLHKRLFTFAQSKGYAERLAEGSFARRVAEGMPEARARYFLDPWNYAYWIRDRCDKETGRRSVFVYSFGPNRSRDSSRWEILGDDIGAYVIQRPSR